MGHLQHLKWPMAVRTPFILSLYGVSGVVIEYSAHNCRYLDFRPSETLIWSFWDICSHLGPKILEMVHLQHIKRHMAVRRQFILRLYGVSGVLIEYSAHNCRYFDFIPFETLILVILPLFSPFGPKILEMGHLQHLKRYIEVTRPFILSLYGV